MSARSSARRSLVGLALVASACASGETEEMMSHTQAWDPDASAGDEEESTAAAGSETPADDGADDSDGSTCATPCTTPPGDCFEDQGACEAGECVEVPVLAGDACTDGCSGGGFCDASGNCLCVEDCAATCVAGEHSTAMCDDAGMCVRACEAPYDNCDGDWSNGCEVPVGVPHVCDASGLVAEGGCWSAYCGESDAAAARNFGTYHCVDCSTCETPSGGMCHWCNHDTGNWYPAEACSCGAEYENAVCGPA
ncbi:MAG TPA: hypothetical protein VFG69_03500 [Nannocystaceae bacterium]|nr:hypothetical protein [Nannocystaceae bacterium]